MQLLGTLKSTVWQLRSFCILVFVFFYSQFGLKGFTNLLQIHLNIYQLKLNKMPRYREWDLACKVYVGNLGSSASKHDIENAFSKYGPLRNVWVARNPPGFAFVEFEDRRDAEDATRALDGTRCCGTRIRVEMSSGRSRDRGRRGIPEGNGGGRSAGRFRITPLTTTTSPH
ncbi:RNA-binding protein 1 isoform X2 [Drosophila nasuta]|uniref:RNA-binding protein 1 isoform X2 n=2 Tax=nasuta subgroup TaxID=32307 RepID=A0A6P8ZB69_DROAB|nr:RNA-binding protein 1 isoform X2 [Drosophila albomicans]XP_060646407.1 RNA-binding protein 1 isoform X2 [Drosophila nasuta]